MRSIRRIACLGKTGRHSGTLKSSFAACPDRCKTSMQDADNDRVHCFVECLFVCRLCGCCRSGCPAHAGHQGCMWISVDACRGQAHPETSFYLSHSSWGGPHAVKVLSLVYIHQHGLICCNSSHELQAIMTSAEHTHNLTCRVEGATYCLDHYPAWSLDSLSLCMTTVLMRPQERLQVSSCWPELRSNFGN